VSVSFCGAGGGWLVAVAMSTVVLVRKSPAWLSAVDAVLEPLLAIAPLTPIQSLTPNTSATALPSF